jgi:general secretion pathway protein A
VVGYARYFAVAPPDFIMYEAYYGLSGRPFSILPDPANYFPSRSHRAVLALLEHTAAKRPGFIVITGAVGTGKTTLLRRMIMKQPRDVAIGFIATPHPRFGSLLGRVLQSFGVEVTGVTPLELIEQLDLFLEELSSSGRKAILVVDEAQVLGLDLLEELRMISNVVVNDQMLQVVLTGQPSLREILQIPELNQLAQRVVMDCELQPLDNVETREYIEYRLNQVGVEDASIFDATAFAAVYEYTGGIPRLINILCEDALIFGSLTQRQQINAEIIRDLALERLHGGLLPLIASSRSLSTCMNDVSRESRTAIL